MYMKTLLAEVGVKNLGMFTVRCRSTYCLNSQRGGDGDNQIGKIFLS